jgi:flagellar motility protein MotE (MotC chaperone)
LSGLYLKSTTAMAEENRAAVKKPTPLDKDLRKRKSELDAREKGLKEKEAELRSLQEKIDARMAELNDLQTKLTKFAKELGDKEKAMKDTQMTHLVALYSSMDPGKAAAIMDKLNMETVVRILRYMKGKNAGKIMDMMAPGRGASISEELSKSN